MNHTLARTCDRAGHGLLLASLFAICAFFAAPAFAEGPGDYKALTFDVTVTPSNGDLYVVETITFGFQSGVFRKVWRDLASERTDGIEVLEAKMDGVSLPRGSGEGQVDVSDGGRAKVQWNFAPVGISVHTFELRYRARGAVYRDGDRDVIRWHALPPEHRYPIDASRIAFVTSGAVAAPPETRHVKSATVSYASPGVIVDATGIGNNGWVIADLRYPAGTLISSLPRWQQDHQRATALAPRWLAAAGALFIGGLLLVLGMRRGSAEAAPAPEQMPATTSPPELVPAAIAAALAAKGRASGNQGVATLLDLAARGVLTIREVRQGFGVRSYQLSQVAGTHDLDEHEEAALAIAFGGSAEDVTVGKARGRLARGGRRFVAALNADLLRHGLIDPDRKARRDRVAATSVTLLLLGAAGAIVAATLVPRYEAWPFLVPLGVFAAGLGGLFRVAGMSSLSDNAAYEAARWQGFKAHLKTVADPRRDSGGAEIDSRWVVYAIALGLAAQWSRYLKARAVPAPPWFQAASQDAGGFAAFVGSHAAVSAGHSGGVSGGGAAGGGASGAG